MYTVVNNSEIRIYKSLPYLQKIKVTSSRDSPVKEVKVTASDLEIEKSLVLDERTGFWKLEFTEEETAKLKTGASFYYLEITYEDETKEEKPYTGRIFVKEGEGT